MTQIRHGLAPAAGSVGSAYHDIGVLAGTAIITDGRRVPVEALCVGDRVLTRAGRRTITNIRCHDLGPTRMVRIQANAISAGVPDCDVVLGADTPVHLVQAGLSNAARMADARGVVIEDLPAARVFQIEFDMPAFAYASTLQVMTCG